MYRKRRRGWIKHIDFMLLDILCMQLAFVVGYMARFGISNPYADQNYSSLAIVFILIDFFVEIVADSFKNVLKRGLTDELAAVCKHVFLVEVVTSFYLFSTRSGGTYSRLSYYMMIPAYIIISYICRCIWKRVLKKRGFQKTARSLLVLAQEEVLTEVLQTVSESCRGYSHISAAVLDADRKGEKLKGIPIVADSGEIADYARNEWVDEVLVAPCTEREFPAKLVEQLIEMGIVVHNGISKAAELSGNRKQIEKIGDYIVVTTSINYASSYQLLFKRLMDIVGGLAGCLVCVLLVIVFAPAIYISSPGNIFFAQERVGCNGRKFKMYKFRTMYLDAEERKKELMEQNRVKDGKMFKLEFDPRIIGNRILPNGRKKEGIGSFLRKTSLDEFPQFFNILKGDMSLVGTRPPTIDEWEQYEPYHRSRLAFRPGLTGLWQTSGRSNITDFEEVVRLDRKYIDEWSLQLDIKLLLKTVIVVFKNDGAM